MRSTLLMTHSSNLFFLLNPLSYSLISNDRSHRSPLRQTSSSLKTTFFDGFFSLVQLKIPSKLLSFPSPWAVKIFSYIVKTSSRGVKITYVTYKQAFNLLSSLKPDVKDLFSTTPLHYLKAGVLGITHFMNILNLVVENVNMSTLEELNSMWSIMLYKGGSKPRGLS